MKSSSLSLSSSIFFSNSLLGFSSPFRSFQDEIVVVSPRGVSSSSELTRFVSDMPKGSDDICQLTE